MTKEGYREYLKSEHWKEVRDERLKIDKRKCYLCGRASALNVHHLRYNTLGHENVEHDLVSLCYKCHSMLHRIIDSSKKEYRLLEAEIGKDVARQKYLLQSLQRRVKTSLVEELWLRDSSFGGDLNIFYDDMKTVNRLLKIVRIIYPNIGKLDIAKDIQKRLKEVSTVLSAPEKKIEIEPYKKPVQKQKKNKNKKRPPKRERKMSQHKQKVYDYCMSVVDKRSKR